MRYPPFNDIRSFPKRQRGLARVATVIQQLKEDRSPLLTTLGGDYLSPSALGTAIVDGKPIAGRHMVTSECTGVDWATFGNHESTCGSGVSRPPHAGSSASSPPTSPTPAGLSPACRRRRSSRSRPRTDRQDQFIGVTIDANPRTG
jgi:hypothetical protein